ncbi:MAG: hypothetical protein JW966_03570 [Anaerolineae bacterium]|nr:hypothetical protein [Anaerolineae bacterium]
MSDLSAAPESNWKSRSYVMGGVLGVAVGLLAAYFYVRASEESNVESPGRIKAMDALGLAVALLSIVRQITDLGANGGKK